LTQTVVESCVDFEFANLSVRTHGSKFSTLMTLYNIHSSLRLGLNPLNTLGSLQSVLMC